MVNWLHPLILTAKSASTSGEITNWEQAMNGIVVDTYWDAAFVEVVIYEKRLRPVKLLNVRWI